MPRPTTIPTRPDPPGRPRHRRGMSTVVVTLAVIACAALAGCSSHPSTETGAPAVTFQDELREAQQMVADASTLVGVTTPPVHRNVEGGNIAGAPDPSIQSRDITVQWIQAQPAPFAPIRDLWTGSFGYTVTSESADDVFLAKGDMHASISQGAPAADGSRNVWFGVITGSHPADEVPEPT